ncbi:MAG: PEP/pyruvate-binding domain-containing protein, partial [Gemmatimonadaceae bacterium]
MITVLADIRRGQTGNYGAKAASLALLAQHGFPVPAAFVVAGSECTRALQQAGVDVEVRRILRSIDYTHIASVEEASGLIREKIRSIRISTRLRNDLLSAYNCLGARYVAVRSSAVGEDSGTASWAGQLSSFLNTSGDQLIDRVKACWASYYNARAIEYRHRLHTGTNLGSVAVIVQTMIRSRSAGVAFSQHPISGDRSVIFVEAVHGLGDVLVSGEIRASTFTIRKRPLAIVANQVVPQARQMVVGNDGGIRMTHVRGRSARPPISQPLLLALARHVARIERLLGGPQDVEWAVVGRSIYLLQARPITTAFGMTSLGPVDIFLAQMREQKMFNPVHNFSAFTGVTGWTAAKYYRPSYLDTTPMPSLVLGDGSDAVFCLSETKMDRLSEEVFLRYWRDEAWFEKRVRAIRTSIDRLRRLYTKATYASLRACSLPESVQLARTVNDLAWATNAMGWFSLSFDLDLCRRSLARLRSTYRPSAREWKRLTDQPAVIPFEERRRVLVYELVASGKTLAEIAEQLQYAYTTYSEVPTIPQTILLLRRECPEHRDSRRVARELGNLRAGTAERLKRCTDASAQFVGNARRLHRYLQAAIEIRDVLRDVICMAHTTSYRVAELSFRKARVPVHLIYFATLDEALSSPTTIRALEKMLKRRRRNGYAILTQYDGTVQAALGAFAPNMERIRRFFEESQGISIAGGEEVRGQTGSLGHASGVVKRV